MSKKKVNVGGLTLGNGHIYIQSMLNIPAEDVAESAAQAVRLEKAGCEIIRAAVPTLDDVKLIPTLKEAVNIPVVADIHFDYRIALACAEAGVDKIRINPGNIGSPDRVKAVADAWPQAEYPHSDRSELRLPGEAASRKIRQSHSGGAGGKRSGACEAAE